LILTCDNLYYHIFQTENTSMAKYVKCTVDTND